MAIRGKIQDFISRQTALDKLSIGLLWMTLPDVIDIWGAVKFLGMAMLTGWIFHRQKSHEENMTNLDP